MNVLFLTIGRFDSIEFHGIYPDLLRCFVRDGHHVYTVSSYEKRLGKPTELVRDKNCSSLHVKTGNLTGCGMIEKGISTVMIGRQYSQSIKKYLSGIPFDLIIYSTPPITLASVVKKTKKATGAETLLLLKDIFPQNAVDIGLMSKTGAKSFLYKHFRSQEKKLYALSDHIGCMSPANVEYLLKHNPEVQKQSVFVSPNSLEPREFSFTEEEKQNIRKKYGMPANKKIFVYGGNLGKPQGIPFLIECLKREKDNAEAFFLLVGSGTEFSALESFIQSEGLKNVRLISSLPKDEYDAMLAACDIGLIFLDHRFTIPNFPSRLLTYMQAGLPVLACTDPNTDLGKIICENGFGWWCESTSAESFHKLVEKALSENTAQTGEKARRYLLENFTAEKQYRDIMRRIK